MTKEEQMIEAGNKAEILLGNDVFNSTINNLVEAAFHTFTDTKPEDTKTREGCYYTYRGLVEIVHTLRQRVNVRDEIINRNSSGEE